MSTFLERADSGLSLRPNSPVFADLNKISAIPKVKTDTRIDIWDEFFLDWSLFEKPDVDLSGRVQLNSPQEKIETKIQEISINRAKLEAHANIVSDSVYLITRAEEFIVTLDPKFDSEISLLSALNIFTGAIGVIDAAERFYQCIKIKHIVGVGESLIKGFKNCADILSGFTGVMLGVDKMVNSFQINTAFSVNEVALKTLNAVNDYATLASSCLSLVSSTISMVRTISVCLGLHFAKSSEDKLNTLGILNFDRMNEDQKIAALRTIKELTDVSLSKEELERYAQNQMECQALIDLEDKFLKGSLETFCTHLFSAVVSILAVILSVGDKFLGGIAELSLQITFLTLSSIKFCVDAVSIYRSGEDYKSGKNDHYFHRGISIFFSSIALAGLITAAVSSAGIVPLTFMIVAIVGPILVNAFVHLASDPNIKEWFDFRSTPFDDNSLVADMPSAYFYG